MLQLPGLAQQGADAGHFSSGASEASQQASQQAPTSAAADMARQLAAGHMSTEDLLAAISSLPKVTAVTTSASVLSKPMYRQPPGRPARRQA